MTTFEVEIREQEGREAAPVRHDVCRKAGPRPVGRNELFTLGAVEWPSEGVAIKTEHRGEIEVARPGCA